MMKSNRNKLGYLFGISSGLLWSINTLLLGIIMNTATFTTSAILIISGGVFSSFLHDTFAAFWVSLFMKIRKKYVNIISLLKLKDTRYLILGALLGGPIGMTFYVLSIKNTSPSITAMITSAYPVLSVIMAILLLKERINARTIIGITITLISVIYLGYTPSEESGVITDIGIIYAVLCAIGWASESVICAYGMKSNKIEPDMALTIRETASFITYFVFVVPFFCGSYDGVFEIIQSPTIYLFIGAGLLGVSSYICWYRSINIIGAAKAVTLNSTYAFWTLVLSITFLGESIDIKKGICCILIIIGVLLTAKED